MVWDDDIKSVETEIMEYLKKRPTATDSLQGIAQWWLVQQEIEKKLTLVEKALEQLVVEGRVIKKESTRDATYCLNPAYQLEKNSNDKNKPE